MDYINARSLGATNYRPPDPDARVDKLVSAIVGKKIMATDTRLIKYVTEWKRNHSEEDSENMLKFPSVITELRELLK